MTALTVAVVVSGCSGPETSLKKAKDALEKKDIASFEEVVDLESVVPSVVQACMSLAKVETTANEVFEKQTTWGQVGKGLGEMLGEAFVGKLTDKLVLDIRNNFGSAKLTKLDGLKGCGGMTLGLPENIKFETAGKTSRAKIPVIIGEGKASTVALRLEDQGDQGWVIKALELGEALQAFEDYQKERVRKQAAELEKQLKDESDPMAFRKLSIYLSNVSDDDPDVTRQREVLREAEAKLRTAKAPILVEKAAYLKQRWSEYASVTVKNPTEREVAEYVVRIKFFDKTGEMIGGSLDKAALMGRDSDGVKPGKTKTGTWSVNSFTWPTDKIRKAEAKVAVVKFMDGEEWTHPAAAAGLWE